MYSQKKRLRPRNFLFLLVSILISLLSPLHASANQENRERAMNVLNYDGIAVGTVVWLRYPIRMHDDYDRVSSLTKLTIIDGDILPEFASIPSSKKQLILTGKKDDGKTVQLVLGEYKYYESGDALRKFYLSDPKEITLKWSKKILKAIEQQSLMLGMTSDQVFLSWGLPTDINTNVGSWGTHEQWIYGNPPNSTYVYVQNDRLTGWQGKQ